LFYYNGPRSFVRNCILLGHHPHAIHNGTEGFAEGLIEPMTWESVNGWTPKGGALLGTKRTTANGKLKEIAANIAKFNLQARNTKVA
jgi:6-phosphofructokinase 1